MVAGHGRLRAAQQLGLASVPCIRLGWLSEAQRKAYLIADNQLALNGNWDEALLALELKDLQDVAFDLPLLGFSDQELQGLLQRFEQPLAGLTDPDTLPPEPEDIYVQPGDLYQMGAHRLLCGDATNPAHVARLLGAARPPLMVTDPPYGVSYDPAWRVPLAGNGKVATGKVTNDDRRDWREAYRLFPGDVAYVWHAGIYAGEVAAHLRECGFEVRSQIIWKKQHFALSRGHYHWGHEPCWYVVRQGATAHWRGDRKQTTVWEVANASPFGGAAQQAEQTGHGTQKPVAVITPALLNHLKEGEAVYDPFSGSGTTIIAAERLGRCCYGMEVEPTYVQVAITRWEEHTGRKAVKVNG